MFTALRIVPIENWGKRLNTRNNATTLGDFAPIKETPGLNKTSSKISRHFKRRRLLNATIGMAKDSLLNKVKN